MSRILSRGTTGADVRALQDVLNFQIRRGEPLNAGADGKPNGTFGAWGDGKFFLDFTGQNSKSRPHAEASGQLILGIQGVF
jgi:hypothetical protein